MSTIDICLNCFDYLFNEKIDKALDIEESAIFVGQIEHNFPPNKFKFHPIKGGNTFWNHGCKECGTCKSTKEEQRFTILAERVN